MVISEVEVSLFALTAFVGCEVNPIVRAKIDGKWTSDFPPGSITFTWYREQIGCSVHVSKPATVQCVTCVQLEVPIQETYHCSTKCYLLAWEEHCRRHCQAAKVAVGNGENDQQGSKRLRSCGSWPDICNGLLLDKHSKIELPEGKVWVKVGFSRNYVPSIDDVGCRLKLEYEVVQTIPVKGLLTHSVVAFPSRCPRAMINLEKPFRPLNFSLYPQLSKDVTFSVLSYNILADVYAYRHKYQYCPPWALMWEYRRKNLLEEIVEYDADIICLQEVQGDHFRSFFEPELMKHGYLAIYKEKNDKLGTPNGEVADGCATFYRMDQFREIEKYEVEFRELALSKVEELDSSVKGEGRIRLAKGNVALVIVLEMKCGNSIHAFDPIICVANTHIVANKDLPDVRLFQAVSLVNELEKIYKHQGPLLICGDFNSLPESDPYKYIVGDKIHPPDSCQEKDPLNLYQILPLYHSLNLVSAYASVFGMERAKLKPLHWINYENRELLFTYFSRNFCATLDYIFYTVDHLEVESLLEFPELASIDVGLPTPQWSSDHVALMARFRFKLRS